MSAIAMRIKGKKGLSAVQRGLAVLRKYGTNAHLWLPGVGAINGQQLGNYLDSAGTTAASVDNPIGLVLDSANPATGPNLVTNGGLTTDLSGWTPINSPITSNGVNGVTLQKNGSTDGQLAQNVPTVVGQSYKVSCFITSPTNNYIFGVTGNNTGYQATPGRITVYFTATSTSTALFLQQGGSAGAATTFGQVTLQAISGIPASQATTANKPTLRRGGVNLLQYSTDLTNAVWSKFWGTVANVSTTLPLGATGLCSRFTQDTSAAQIHRVANASQYAAGVPYTNVVVLRADGTRYVYINANAAQAANVCVDLNTGATATAGANVSNVFTKDLGNGWWWVQYSGVGTGSGGNFWLQANTSLVATDNSFTGDGASSFFVAASAQIAGVVSYTQIQACGGIPLTTSAPASSSLGNWGWQGNGSSTVLTKTPTITASDDFVSVVGATLSTSTGGGYFVIAQAVGNTSTSARIGTLAVGPSNVLQAHWANDAAGSGVSSPGSVAVGTPFVFSGQVKSSVLRSRVNGGSWGNSTTVTGTITLNTSGLGSANGFNAWAGMTYPYAEVKGTVSDSDLLAIERMVAAFTGPTGVIF